MFKGYVEGKVYYSWNAFKEAYEKSTGKKISRAIWK